MNRYSAPGSSNVAGTSPGGFAQPQVPSSPASTLDLSSLQNASRVLQEQFLKDMQAVPDLGDMLTIPGVQSSSSYSVFPDDYRIPFQKRKFVPIPEDLFQYFTTTQVNTHMGLLPEIERAWVSIDHNLFLWDYVDGREISSYTEQPDVITSVALVKPKPGVFIDDITSLLVICSPISITLLGLSAADALGLNNQARKEIKLYATDMSISTDVEMGSVVGTTEGRIFMRGAQDGNLYELHYQDKEGWFGKRVQLINHSIGGVQSLLPRLTSPRAEDRITSVLSDQFRGCLYTLTASNVISVYRTNGDKAIQHIQTLSNLYKAAQDKAPGSPALTPKAFVIVSLHVVEPTRSQNGVHLMAMTTNGTRLFFSPSPGYGYGYGSAAPSRQLQLVHVRLPPPNLLHPDEQATPHRHPGPGYNASQPQQQTSRPYVVSGLDPICYSAGLIVAAQPGETDTYDFLLCMSPDLTQVGSFQQASQVSAVYSGAQTQPPLVERAILTTIPGRTWAMAPALQSLTTLPPGFHSDTSSPVPINELATQFSESAPLFMILTNAGLSYVAKRRAMDYLKDVIGEYQIEGNAQSLIHFRDSFGRDQTCAMLLSLASGNAFMDFSDPSSSVKISTVSSELAAVAKQAFYDFGERPTWSERVTYGTSEGSGTATFSGRREGLALYFARLLRPIWKAKLTKSGTGGQQPNISETTLVAIQQNLFALKDFLEKNPQLFHSSPSDHAGARSATASEQEAWKVEQNSVSQLLNLLSRTVEALSFFLLLVDHHLNELISQCEPAIQKSLQELTFEQLVTDAVGVQASRALVNVIINQQIGQQISVDTISEVLQQRCGSFCSTDDVMLYKARENVRKAAETSNPLDRQNWLGESLRLFTKASRILELDKLREICGDYQQLSYARGTVELPLYCAQVSDVDRQGQGHWLAGCPANDDRATFWQARLKRYDLILDSLSVFEERCSSPNALAASTSDPDAVRTHAYELAFASEDEMFHSVLYDWLIQRGLADELLEMRPVYLEAHLRRDPVTEQKSQLLWQFYVKDKQPLRAAEVLSTLAETSEFDIPLDSRLEYLTLAVGNAKSHPISAGGGHEEALAFLTDLEEKLEVAQVQLELYHTLLPRINESAESSAKIKLLAKGMYNISQLYQSYAEPFDLPNMKLLIIHVSEHRDENFVRPIWNRIFEEAMDGVEPEVAADRIQSRVQPLGQRLYPSVSAFPLRHIASLLVRFTLANKKSVPHGWAPRILIQCGVPYADVWDILHEMYESQIPPFNDQANVQTVSSDIAVLLADWVDAARRPKAGGTRGEFPVYRIDAAIDQYMSELEPSRVETRNVYETIKRQLRRNW